MEDMNFGRISINETTTTSSNKSTAKSIDGAHQTSIDTLPEAGKFSLTYNTNEGVVLGEPKDGRYGFRPDIDRGNDNNIDKSTAKSIDAAYQTSIDDTPPEAETPREKEQSNTEEAAIDLEEEEEELEEDVEIDRQEGTNVDRPTTVNIDRQIGNNVDRRSAPAEPAVEGVYRTLPPFPPKKAQIK
ncbi:hypothetical protein DY000_02021158 [Brassica cretica]|uniref:Uncharacterized protein n=1 Tax=Brassica cretica TaxID=69181 RepID=A0ABQ7EC37_BRACR|nr:hypothetical protein DY000_02021158 [Brassica cretica]